MYGAGVIGALTIHELMQAGNDVSVVARGSWKKVLEEIGLCIQSSNGKKQAVDHPRVLAADDGQEYDAVFSIMQNQQQEALLDTLAATHARYFVLVGNNMLAGKMDCLPKKKVLCRPFPGNGYESCFHG